jgi:peptidoglycan/xylan/chitin deacetylase (PgdA/CDA1 family)
MIYLLCPGNLAPTANIVAAALLRSCGQGAVTAITPGHLTKLITATSKQPPLRWIVMVVAPPPAWDALLCQLHASTGVKLLVFGAVPAGLARRLAMTGQRPLSVDEIQAASCAPAAAYEEAASALELVYDQTLPGLSSPIARRPFLRYDFTDEWNNLGYGAIRADASQWACAGIVDVPAGNCLAHIENAGIAIGAYAALWVTEGSSTLWFNRAVGPVDSAEWQLVEQFLAHHRHGQLACQPVLLEIPYGYAVAVTMRLDCDEEIESARPLWQAYCKLGVPLSLALHAKVLADPAQHQLPKDVINHGGALLSHTATHAPNWGGSYDAALAEGEDSAQAIRHATGYQVRYAVSPFHQTPDYARAALADVGYEGCVGGIIRNDPDFLMARAGTPPGSAHGFIGHSQQCMLHGDCLLANGDPLRIFKQAFDIARASGTFFGYLDHPFSERYSYGWQDEPQRIAMHRQFIAHIQQQPGVLWANEEDALDFLAMRAAVRVITEDNAVRLQAPASRSAWQVAVAYAGQVNPITPQGLTL